MDDMRQYLEQERQQFAQQLHENITQPLGLLLAQITIYEQTSPQAQMLLSVLAMMTRQLLQQARDMEDNLYPTALYHLGLEPALELLAGQWERKHGCHVQLDLERLQNRLPTLFEITLYRLIQQWLGATLPAMRLHIRLHHQAEGLHLQLIHEGEALPQEKLLALKDAVAYLRVNVPYRPTRLDTAFTSPSLFFSCRYSPSASVMSCTS